MTVRYKVMTTTTPNQCDVAAVLADHFIPPESESAVVHLHNRDITSRPVSQKQFKVI